MVLIVAFWIATFWHTGGIYEVPDGSWSYAAKVGVLALLFVFTGFVVVTRILRNRLSAQEWWYLVGLSISIAWSLAVKQEVDSALWSAQFIAGFFGAYFLAEWGHIGSRLVRNSIVIGLGVSLAVAAIGGQYPLQLLPFSNADWRVTVMGSHYSAILGYLVFVMSAHLYIESRKRVDALLSVVAVYFIVFSGGRSELAALVLAVGLMLLVYGLRVRSATVLGLAPLCAVVMFYVVPGALQGTVLPGFPGRALKMADARDLTAGRAWLWSYHWDLFLANPIVGAPAAKVDIKKDDHLKSGERVRAGSESFFTRLLAYEGVASVPKFALYLYLLYLPIARRMWSAYILWSGILIIVAGLSLTNSMYHYKSFIAVLGYFSLLVRSGDRAVKAIVMNRGVCASH